MIDIHIHILPGVDDGAKSLSDTLKMARIAAENGITDIVATPHCNIPGHYQNYFGREYKQVFWKAADAIRQSGIPVKLYPGMEVYVTDQVPDLIRQKKIVPLNCSHYLLVEFDFRSDPGYADLMLDKIASMGLIPVVAHVERYHFLQDDPVMAKRWREKGYAVQVNKASYLGKFGEKEQNTVEFLTEQKWVDVIATDAHSPRYRTPSMESVYEELYTDYPEEYIKKLLVENPRRICRDQPLRNN